MRVALLLLLSGCYNVDSLSANFVAPDLSMASPAGDDLSSPPVNDLSSLPDGGGDASAVPFWEPVQSPVSANLRALAADGNDLFAVGASSTILHIAADDSITPENPGPGYNLRGAASAGGQVWAVGDNGTVLQRSTGWINVGPTDDTLYGAFALGATDVVSVGSAGHFDRNLISEDTGNSIALFSVWARNGSDIFIVGESGTILHRGADAGVFSALTSNTTSDLHGVFGSGATLFAAGAAGTLLRSDDSTSWSAETITSTADLFAVWITGTEAFVVGDGGLILHRKGGAWSVEHSGGPALRAVVGRSATDVWAVGDGGTILRYQP
jgi:hypothetical protein